MDPTLQIRHLGSKQVNGSSRVRSGEEPRSIAFGCSSPESGEEGWGGMGSDGEVMGRQWGSLSDLTFLKDAGFSKDQRTGSMGKGLFERVSAEALGS